MSEPESHASGLTPEQAWWRYQRYPYLLTKVVLFTLIGGTVYLLFHSVEAVLFPVLASLLIAYLLDPMVDRFEARGWSRTRAILMLLLVGFGATGLFLVFLVPTLVQQVQGIAEGVPKLAARVEQDLLPWLQDDLGIALPESASAVIAQYGETLKEQVPTLAKAVSAAAGSVVSSVGAVVASLVNIVMIPVFTFYFLRDFDVNRERLVQFVPTLHRDFYLSRMSRMDEVVGAWFRGQLEVALILAVMYGIGLGVVFGWAGVGFAAGISVGVLAGLLNIIPYFGFVVGFSLSVLMVLLGMGGVGPLVGVVGVFVVVQGLEGWLITPKIVGEKVGLPPVVVIIALLLGQELLGIVGVLLALPIAGALRVLAPDFVAYYKSARWYTGDPGSGADNRGFVEVALAAEAAREAASATPSAVEGVPDEVAVAPAAEETSPEASASDASMIETPSTETPATEAPATEAPATETSEPKSESEGS